MTEEEKPKPLSLKERMALKKQAGKIEEFHIPTQAAPAPPNIQNPNANASQPQNQVGTGPQLGTNNMQQNIPAPFMPNQGPKVEKGPLMPNMPN